MEYEWDSDKRGANLAKHRVDFATIVDFDWDTAVYQRMGRPDEVRYRALGMVGDRLYIVIYTLRGETVRVISMWLAGRRAWRRYVG